MSDPIDRLRGLSEDRDLTPVSYTHLIVMGRTNNQKRLFLPNKSLVDRLTAVAPNLDIYIIPDNQPPYRPVAAGCARIF